MKKVLLILAVLAFALPAFAQDQTNVVSQRTSEMVEDLRVKYNATQDRVDTVLDESNNVVASSLPGSSLTNSVIVDATVAKTLTSVPLTNDPDYPGQLLLWTQTNTVWIATGGTTNDWIVMP